MAILPSSALSGSPMIPGIMGGGGIGGGGGGGGGGGSIVWRGM